MENNMEHEIEIAIVLYLCLGLVGGSGPFLGLGLKRVLEGARKVLIYKCGLMSPEFCYNYRYPKSEAHL